MSCPCIGLYCSRYLAKANFKEARLLPQSDAYRVFSVQPKSADSVWSRFRKPCVPALLFAPRHLEVDVFLQLTLHSTATLAVCAYSTEADQWGITSISYIDAAVHRDNAGSPLQQKRFTSCTSNLVPANNAIAWNRGYVCRWPKLASPTEFTAYRRATMCVYSARSLSSWQPQIRPSVHVNIRASLHGRQSLDLAHLVMSLYPQSHSTGASGYSRLGIKTPPTSSAATTLARLAARAPANTYNFGLSAMPDIVSIGHGPISHSE